MGMTRQKYEPGGQRGSRSRQDGALALQLLDGFHVALLLAPDLSLVVVERPEGAGDVSAAAPARNAQPFRFWPRAGVEPDDPSADRRGAAAGPGVEVETG
jgi:hypothetical protein